MVVENQRRVLPGTGIVRGESVWERVETPFPDHHFCNLAFPGSKSALSVGTYWSDSFTRRNVRSSA